MTKTPATSLTICHHPSNAAERSRYARKVRRGEYIRPYRGLYAPKEDWEQLGQIDQARSIICALGRIHPAWVFCSFSAAAIYGLEIGRDRALPLHACTRKGRRNAFNGRLVHHPEFTGNPMLVGGVRCTPPTQTVIDCLLELDFSRGLAVADSALRILGSTKEELFAALATRSGHPNIGVAKDAIALADGRSENGGESVARAVMIEQGFMIPELQVWIPDPFDPAGGYRVDYRWYLGDNGTVIGELDGKDKYVDPEMIGENSTLDVLLDERHRESRVTLDGTKVLRFSFKDVMNSARFVRMLEMYGIPRGAARAGSR